MGKPSDYTLVDVVADVFSGVSTAISKVKDVANQALNAVKAGLQFIYNAAILPIIEGFKTVYTSFMTMMGILLSTLIPDIQFSNNNGVFSLTLGQSTMQISIDIDGLNLIFNINGLRIKLSNLFLLPIVTSDSLGLEGDLDKAIIVNDISSIGFLLMAAGSGNSFSESSWSSTELLTGFSEAIPIEGDQLKPAGVALLLLWFLTEIPKMYHYLTDQSIELKEKKSFFATMALFHTVEFAALSKTIWIKWLEEYGMTQDTFALIMASILWETGVKRTVSDVNEILETHTLEKIQISGLASIAVSLGLDAALLTTPGAEWKIAGLEKQVTFLSFIHMVLGSIDWFIYNQL